MSIDAGDSVYALLTDGATIEIRPARPGDFDAVRDMHAKMSPKNLYLRFFSMSPSAAEQEARRICREPAPDHAALLAVLDGEGVGCAREQVGAGSRSAEVALAVDDDRHNRGIGMLLLEHLVALGRGQGFRAFTAHTLSENAAMLRVFADAGLQAQRSLADGVYDLTFPLPAGEADAALGTYLDTVAARERAADVASMQPVLMPASVAVIGASRRAGSVGRVILRNIISGGFSGPVYPVNPYASELDGIACVPSVAALPDQVDLAVIAVPAGAVLGIADDCGRRGQGLVVIAAGLSGPAARSCWGSAAATAWDGRAGQLRRGQPGIGLTRHSPPATPGPELSAWRCSPPAAPASRCWSICPGWAWESPPWSPSATRTTCPAPTCCSGGSVTRRQSWPCCT
jgi:predicted CoA-binding protein/GNAT superfamily N-acetyltransferase